MANPNDDFFLRVWKVVEQIPLGRVTTYGAVARHLGLRSGARMVGWAMNHSGSYDGNDLPAHRVVNRNGELTGAPHFGGDVMRQLLLQENITFLDERRVDLDRHFWDPSDPMNPHPSS